MAMRMLYILLLCLLLDPIYPLSSGFSATHHKFGTYFTRWTGEKCQSQAPALVCIHGFGGNADQFRKNLPAFQENGFDSFAFDLLGYGYSDKPDPREFGVNEIYNFETWADQTVQFIDTTVHKPCVLVCNSIGGLVGLQAAILRPDLVKGLVLINMSLRLLHEKKQLPSLRPLISTTQTLLRATPFGRYFFKQLLKPDILRLILNQAYGYQRKPARPLPEPATATTVAAVETAGKVGAAAVAEAVAAETPAAKAAKAALRGVDEETLQVLLRPGQDPRAADVFLDFTSYSTGALPEDLLPLISCPVSILWGERDPWEPVALGRSTFAAFPCVREFVVLPEGGHCPMDQIPDQVNENVLRFVRSLEGGEGPGQQPMQLFGAAGQ